MSQSSARNTSSVRMTEIRMHWVPSAREIRRKYERQSKSKEAQGYTYDWRTGSWKR